MLRPPRRAPLRCTGNALNNSAVLMPATAEVKKWSAAAPTASRDARGRGEAPRINGVSRWLAWFATNTAGLLRDPRSSLPSTRGRVHAHTQGLSIVWCIVPRRSLASAVRAHAAGNGWERTRCSTWETRSCSPGTRH
jgi:hypothetical protein